MDSIQEIMRQEAALKEILADLPQQKWKILKYIVWGTIFSLIAPFLFRDLDLSERNNYLHAATAVGVGTLAVIALLSYHHITTINYEIYSIKFDLEQLKQKRIALEQAEE